MRYTARHYAFLGPPSVRAAEASECAAEQGKFWEYRTAVFTNQGQLRASNGWDLLKRWAGELGLDQARFDACVDSGRYSEIVRAESAEADRLGVPGTPSIYVNGELIKGASGGIPTVEEVGAAVDRALAAKGQ